MRRQTAFGAASARTYQSDPRRSLGRAGGGLRRRQPLGDDVVRAVRIRRGRFRVAEQLSKSKNTSVAGMVQARILSSRGGKVRLFKPEELPANWDPATDPRLTAWEVVHQLIRALEAGGKASLQGWWQNSATRLRSPASWPTVSTRFASAKNEPPRRYPITGWSKAGLRLPGSRARWRSCGPRSLNSSKGRSDMAVTNHERVGKGLDLLKGGLGPFVDREFKSAYKDRAAAEASRDNSPDRVKGAGGSGISRWIRV